MISIIKILVEKREYLGRFTLRFALINASWYLSDNFFCSSVLFILNLETPIEKEISMAFLFPSVSWGLKVNWDYGHYRYLITAQDIQEGLERKAYENTITYMTRKSIIISIMIFSYNNNSWTGSSFVGCTLL